MGVQVVHHEDDLLSLRADVVRQAPDLLGPVHCGPRRLHSVEDPAGVRLYEAEHACRAVPDVLRVDFGGVARPHREWLPRLVKQLERLLVHAPQGPLLIVGLLVHVKDVLHGRHEVGVRLGWNAPVLAEVRPQVIALQDASYGWAADPGFQDHGHFLPGELERPARLPFRGIAAGLGDHLGLGLDVAGGLEVCRVGAGAAPGLERRLDPFVAEVPQRCQDRGGGCP